MKTNELIGAALDWAVAQAQGNVRLQYDSREGLVINNVLGWIPYRPSEAWQQGGPIIEREKIRLRFEEEYPYLSVPPMSTWVAHYENVWDRAGPTPLIAAMRAFVAHKLGDDVEVPEELK